MITNNIKKINDWWEYLEQIIIRDCWEYVDQKQYKIYKND